MFVMLEIYLLVKKNINKKGISTPLLIKYLREISKKSGPYSKYGRIPMTFMFQEEVGDVK
jgi:hypothetical protein